MLDAEARRTGRSMSSLIRDGVGKVDCASGDVETDLRWIEQAAGAWQGREEDGAAFVEPLRSGRRMDEASAR